jgi:hypothetical protein
VQWGGKAITRMRKKIILTPWGMFPPAMPLDWVSSESPPMAVCFHWVSGLFLKFWRDCLVTPLPRLGSGWHHLSRKWENL